MAVILRLVSGLHSRSFKERHWKKLMEITGKNIQFNSPELCFDDIIQLELHRYFHEVNELLICVKREAVIEVSLRKIACVWEVKILPFIEYKE